MFSIDIHNQQQINVNPKYRLSMKRREFLAAAATTSVVSLAGCSGSTGPQMEVQRLTYPEPAMVSVDVDDNDTEHFATIQNQGDSGNIRLELWYMRDTSTPTPSAPSIYLDDTDEGQYFDLARTFFFDSGERREESIFASSDAPPFEEFPDYYMIPWAGSYGAVFENTGDTGEVEFSFEYRDSMGYEPTKPDDQMTTVGSDSTVEVVFDTVAPPQAEYEIIADPV